MKIRKNPKKNRTRHAIPVVILSTVLLFTMSVFYIDSTSSSAAGTDHLLLPDSTVTNTASDNSTDEGSDNSTDEDGTTEYLVTTEYTDEPGKATELSSNYAIVLDANTGNILYQKNAFDKQYPASITKIMTFLLAIENTKLTDTVTMSHDAVFGIDRGSSHIGLDEGEQISMEDALYGMMLESANEVAWGIGEFVSGGSIEDFAKMMNERAVKLGCLGTHFVNANGLPDENHYTTCYDMALITKACLGYDEFRKVTGTRNHVIGPTNICEEERQLWQHCKMTNPDSKYYYEYCEGGKTGYTNDALNTLVTWSKKGDTELICVLMNCNGAANTYTDSKAIYEYCFRNYSLQTPLADYTFDSTQTSQTLDYLNSYYKADSASDITLQIDKDYKLNFNKNDDIKKLTYSIEYNKEPVKDGDTYTVGHLILSYGGNMIGTTDLTVTGYNPDGKQLSSKNTENAADTTVAAPITKKKLLIRPLWIIFAALLLLAILFVIYLIHIKKARKRQRAIQAARRKQYEERRRQLQETFDNDLDE